MTNAEISNELEKLETMLYDRASGADPDQGMSYDTITDVFELINQARYLWDMEREKVKEV